MTTRFRIQSILINTTNGPTRYEFESDLTVLAGKTGVGKTTLLELVKFGLGGNGILADVVREHVNEVELQVHIGDSRLRLTRSTESAKRNTVRVVDLITREPLTDHHADSKRPSLNSLLMAALNLPDDLHAAAQSGSSSKAGSRITFADIFSFLYIPQSAINRDIAHSQESYREPTRKAVFELLFALTDPEVLHMRSEVNLLNGKITEAEKEYNTVLAFLRDSNTKTREDADMAMSESIAAQASAEVELANLRHDIEPIADRETQVFRDLLGEAERALADARKTLVDLARQQAEYVGEHHRVQTDIRRLERMRDAGEHLAEIEFRVCPRCMQSLTDRIPPTGACPVCLQPDLVATDNDGHTNHYESNQLADQIAEMDDYLRAITRQIDLTREATIEREQLVESLNAKLDARTAERVSPRLQAYSDAVSRHAYARVQQEQLEQVLRQWDRADDLKAAVVELHSNREQIKARIEVSRREIEARRGSIIDSISEEFQNAALALGIPGVETASIHPTNYLPMLNGQIFSSFSPAGGGIVTATQVAYWTSLLNVALRDEQARYPAFLMIDSPRLALNTSEELCFALYLRLTTQASSQPGRVQLIIADNELPAEYRREYEEIDFTYDSPTIATVHHPGPAGVKTITSEA